MFEDIRSFLTYLENQGQLLRVKDEVGIKYEIAAGMRKTSDIEGPALLFENIKGYPGWRVLGGLFATRKLVALGLGVPREQMLERYLTLKTNAFRLRLFRARRAKKSNGPVIRSICPSCPSSHTRAKIAVLTSPSACRWVKIPTPASVTFPFTVCWSSVKTGYLYGRRPIITWAG